MLLDSPYGLETRICYQFDVYLDMGWEIQPLYIIRIGMDLLVLVQEENSYVGRVISCTQFFWSHFLYLVADLNLL